MPTRQDLPAIQRGDTVPYTLEWTDGTNPIDMRGKSLVMTFKLDAVIPDDEASLIKSVAFSTSDTQAQAGVTSFRLERSETSTLQANTRYAYAFRVIEPDTPENIEITLLSGSILVEDS